MVRPIQPGARDTAASIERFFEFSLLGLLASGYLAVVGSGQLDWPTILVGGMALALRGLMAAGVWQPAIPAPWVTAATIAYLGFYPLDWRWISRDFTAATVHLLFFVAAARILTARTSRDHGFLVILAFAQLLAAALLSANLNFFLFLALFLGFAVATLASAELRRCWRRRSQVARGGRKGLVWRLAVLSAALAVGILVLTASLFFVLPRTARAAFQRLAPERYRLPGFSSEVTLGQIGQILQSHRPVMHVRVLEPRRRLELKWRGVALSRFDGKRWFNPPRPTQVLPVRDRLLSLGGDAVWGPAERLSYEVLLNRWAADALFFAGKPELVWINLPAVIRGPNDTLRPAGMEADMLRYGVHGFLPDEAAARKLPRRPVPAEVLECCLELPPLDPRISELARRLTEGFTSAEASARTIESYLRENYLYTTELPKQQPSDPVAHFLFERRKGHCEYFASAMAVLLRSIGIPSRLVTGFQSGIYNPVSGWYVLRASDAHSWVEAYLPASGWTTFDPTPPDPSPRRLSALSRLGFYLDAAETFWQDWVLSYDLTRQLALASRVGQSSRTFGERWLTAFGSGLGRWRRLAEEGLRRYGVMAPALLAAAGVLALAVPPARRWWRTRASLRQIERGRARASDATLLYQRMLALLARRGYQKPPWLTPAEFAEALPASELADAVRRFTTAYNRLRYGGRREEGAALPALLEAIERSDKGRAR